MKIPFQSNVRMARDIRFGWTGWRLEGASMRTGFDMLESGRDAQYDDFMTKVTVLLDMFQKDAAVTAQRLARCKGYPQASEQDMFLALKYQVIHFFQQGQDLEERFVTGMQEAAAYKEGGGEEEGEEEEGEEEEGEEEEGEEDEEEGDEEEGDEEEGEEETFDPEAEIALFEEVNRIESEWSQWEPDNDVQKMLKSAVDASIRECG